MSEKEKALNSRITPDVVDPGLLEGVLDKGVLCTKDVKVAPVRRIEKQGQRGTGKSEVCGAHLKVRAWSCMDPQRPFWIL